MTAQSGEATHFDTADFTNGRGTLVRNLGWLGHYSEGGDYWFFLDVLKFLSG